MRAELRLVVTLALAIVTGVTLMALHRQIYGAGENAQKVQVALARQLVEGFDGTSFLVEAEGTCLPIRTRERCLSRSSLCR